MALGTFSISALTDSATFASSFMQLIRVAKIAFAGYFVSSTKRTSVITNLSYLGWNSARGIKTGRNKIGTLEIFPTVPYLRYSGLEITCLLIVRARLLSLSTISAYTLSAVHTGIIDLSTTVFRPWTDQSSSNFHAIADRLSCFHLLAYSPQ